MWRITFYVLFVFIITICGVVAVVIAYLDNNNKKQYDANTAIGAVPQFLEFSFSDCVFIVVTAAKYLKLPPFLFVFIFFFLFGGKKILRAFHC